MTHILRGTGCFFEAVFLCSLQGLVWHLGCSISSGGGHYTFPHIQTRHRNQGCKEIYLFWRAVQRSTKGEETHTYDPAIPLLEVCFRENCVQGDVYKENICNSTRVKQPTLCREMGKVWFIHTTDKSNFHILRFGEVILA